MGKRSLIGGLLVVAFLALLTPGALAQEDATAMAEPERAQPGEDLMLAFEVPPPDLVEVAVQENLNCTVTFPDGRDRHPCGQAGSLIQLQTQGDGDRSYTLPYQAPSEEGRYEVRFETRSTARVPAEEHSATTTFVVAEGSPTPQGTDEPGGPDAPPGEEDPAGDEPPPEGERRDGPSRDQADDAGVPSVPVDDPRSRVFVQGTLALGVVGVALAGSRWPLGG